MSTNVALRGKLELVDAPESKKKKRSSSSGTPARSKRDSTANEQSAGATTSEKSATNSTLSTGRSDKKRWQWKGVWAFGTHILELPNTQRGHLLQPQQPFCYTWNLPADPSTIQVPSSAATVVSRRAEMKEQMEEELEIQKQMVVMKNEATAAKKEEKLKGEPLSTSATPQKGETKTEEDQPSATASSDAKAASVDNTKDPKTEKPDDTNTADTKKEETSAPADSIETTKPVADKNDVSQNATAETKLTEESQDKESIEQMVSIDSFATVCDGESPFQDASEKFPEKCPPGGKFLGYFENAVPTKSSRSPQNKTKTQRVNEHFFLFFNAAPGASCRTRFSEASGDNPHKVANGAVHVRGMGQNPFGQFELVGSLDLETGILECQRKYVVFETEVYQKRKRRTAAELSAASAGRLAGSDQSDRPYFTRKRPRVPTWKRQSLDDGRPQEQQGRRKKRAKSTDGAIEVMTATVATEPTVPPPKEKQAEPDQTASMSQVVDSSASKATDLKVEVVISTQTTPAAGKRSGVPGVSKRRSSSSNGKAGAAGATQTVSNHMKLPPCGEPKKARWKAAHFLYYHRTESESKQESESPTSAGNKGKNELNSASSSSSAIPSWFSTSTSSSGYGKDVPKYVVYEGEMLDCMREGRGICLYSNGLMYEGAWKRNKEHGKGKLMSSDRKRLVYHGDFERGRIQGIGTYYYNSAEDKTNAETATDASPSSKTESDAPKVSSRYEGDFRENMRHGFGKYVLSDGSEYSGMWREGMMNGRGVFIWPDGSLYDGEWKDGKRSGQGLLKVSDGFVYDGMWVNNAMDGRGSAIYPNGQRYEGLFSNGRREGRGTIHFTNDLWYSGRFRDDAVDGQGTMKMSRTMAVPKNQNDTDASADKMDVDTDKELDFMIPISFQSDMIHIHAKAGFTAVGD